KGTASTGKAFLTIYFVDATGEIDAKLWDVSTEDVNTFKDGTIVKVTGDINEFRGKAQMRVKAIRPAQTTDGVKVSDFLEKAPVDKTDLQEQVNAAIFAMENPSIQRIVRSDVYIEDVNNYKDGTIVKVTGDINEFRGKAQMRVKAIRPAQTTDGVKVSDFLEKAPVDKTDLQDQVNAAIFAMENPSIQRIVRAIVKKYQEDLFVYPAASKNHHAFVSGLAYHVVTMLKIAESL